MAWTTPRTWATGDVVTAAMMNANVRDDLNFLYGDITYTAPTYANSWVDYGGVYETGGFRLIGTTVWIKGVVRSGTIGATIFTLPTGYRPAQNTQRPNVSNAVFGSFEIQSGGAVVSLSGNNASFNIACTFINF